MILGLPIAKVNDLAELSESTCEETKGYSSPVSLVLPTWPQLIWLTDDLFGGNESTIISNFVFFISISSTGARERGDLPIIQFRETFGAQN